MTSSMEKTKLGRRNGRSSIDDEETLDQALRCLGEEILQEPVPKMLLDELQLMNAASQDNDDTEETAKPRNDLTAKARK